MRWFGNKRDGERGGRTGMPKGIQSASAEVLHELNGFLGALLGSRAHCQLAANDAVVCLLNVGQVPQWPEQRPEERHRRNDVGQ